MNPVEQFFNNLWAYFNGKKTVIGSALLMMSTLFQEVVIEILEYDEPWEHKLIRVLNYVGFFLGGTGMAHKMIKPKTSEEPPTDKK